MATNSTNAIPTYDEVKSIVNQIIDNHETLAKIGYFNNGVLNDTVLMNFRNTHVNIVHCYNVTLQVEGNDDAENLDGCNGLLILNAIGDQLIYDNTCVFIGESSWDNTLTLFAIGDVENGLFKTSFNFLAYP